MSTGLKATALTLLFASGVVLHTTSLYNSKHNKEQVVTTTNLTMKENKLFYTQGEGESKKYYTTNLWQDVLTNKYVIEHLIEEVDYVVIKGQNITLNSFQSAVDLTNNSNETETIAEQNHVTHEWTPVMTVNECATFLGLTTRELQYSKFELATDTATTIGIAELVEDVIEDNTPNGENILDPIKDGIGMADTLAENFLAGFTALFWDAEHSTLTNFGIYSLVFLGIAITMAVIKLSLSILRRNTGV